MLRLDIRNLLAALYSMQVNKLEPKTAQGRIGPGLWVLTSGFFKSGDPSLGLVVTVQNALQPLLQLEDRCTKPPEEVLTSRVGAKVARLASSEKQSRESIYTRCVSMCS